MLDTCKGKLISPPLIRYFKIFHSLCFWFFISIFSESLSAQQDDFGASLGLSLEKSVSRSITFSLANRNLFNQNLAEWWIAAVDAGVEYKLVRGLSTSLHYRNIRFRNQDNVYEPRNLFYHTIGYSLNHEKWSFALRQRTQSLVYGEHFNDTYRGPRWYSRTRAQIRYRINYYWQPFFQFEWFKPLNHPSRSGIDQVRYTGGLSYTWNEKWSLDFLFQNMRQLARKSNNRMYLVGLNVQYTLK